MKTAKTIFERTNNANTFWLFLFMISCFIVSAQDSLKTNYDLNDPRNPQCPCHKYQKLADEEYKKLQASANKNTGSLKTNTHTSGSNENLHKTDRNFSEQGNHFSNTGSNFPNKNLSGNNNVSKKKLSGHTKHRHKKGSRKFAKWKKIFDVKHWDIWKELIDPSSCYHWK